jgi:hypothetical protein
MSKPKSRVDFSDLPGLDQHEIFHNAAPYACLSVQGQTDVDRLGAILSKYGLDYEPSEHKDVFHLVSRKRKDGQHKMQAVILFVAGLELVRTFEHVRVHLSEISRLHHHLAVGTGGPTHFTPDSRVAGWLYTDAPYSVEGIVTHHLRQAGFPLAARENDLHFTRDQVAALDRHLVACGLEKQFLNILSQFNTGLEETSPFRKAA